MSWLHLPNRSFLTEYFPILDRAALPKELVITTPPSTPSPNPYIANKMLRQTILALAGLAAIVAAKQCTNVTVPVEINARQGLFNVPEILTNEDVTTFFQNVSIPSLWPHEDGSTSGLRGVSTLALSCCDAMTA
jgi:hypothetical protein